jgi:hypothetical protein
MCRRWVRRFAWTAALASCGGPSPVGDWTGTFEIQATNGDTYVNEMTVDKHGADVTLYSLLPGEDPKTGEDAKLIAVSSFTATWERTEDVTFLLMCDWDGCVYDPSMDCLFEDDGSMHCDMTPDFYDDDELALVWEEVQ